MDKYFKMLGSVEKRENQSKMTEIVFDTLQKEIESDTGIKFGVIEEFTFSDIVIGILYAKDVLQVFQ